MLNTTRITQTYWRKQVSSSVGFISQQDDAPAHTAKLAKDWIATNCSELLTEVNGHQTHRTLTR